MFAGISCEIKDSQMRKVIRKTKYSTKYKKHNLNKIVAKVTYNMTEDEIQTLNI